MLLISSGRNPREVDLGRAVEALDDGDASRPALNIMLLLLLLRRRRGGGLSSGLSRIRRHDLEIRLTGCLVNQQVAGRVWSR